MPEEVLQPVIITAPATTTEIVVINESPIFIEVSPNFGPPFDTGVFVFPEQTDVVDAAGTTVVVMPNPDPIQVIVVQQGTTIIIS